MRGRPGRAGAALVVAAAVLPLLTAAAEAQSPLADPASNIPRTPAMGQACGTGSGLQCQQAVLQAVNQARASEGVGPLVLPAYYDSLSVPEQLLVLADLERVNRGLPGFGGLSAQLDSLAFQGAAANTDPNGPPGSSWGSNWAGGEASALLADYDWMYDDGYGSPNLDCTGPSASGCWDHRRNVLGNYGPHPSMGAAEARVDGVTSMTELFSSGPAGHLDYAMGRPLPAQVTPEALEIGTTPTAANSAMLTVSGAGPFQASARVAGDAGRWWVTPSCTATAGEKCHLLVTFVPSHSGTASATVTVELPGRTEHVDVTAFAGHGYWEATSQGQIVAFAGGGLRGSVASTHLDRPVVGMAATPNGGGYWEVAADGGVFSFGNARFYGSAAGPRSRDDFVGMAVAHDGSGYWLATRDGAVYPFGEAKFYGSPGAEVADVVGIAATPNGSGYWLVTRRGQVLAFGDARAYGSRAGLHMPQRVVGMAADHDGRGYWLLTSNGHVFPFGDAHFYGSLEGDVGTAVGIAAPAVGHGYYVAVSQGEVFPFGGAPSPGAATSRPPGGPVVAMATA